MNEVHFPTWSDEEDKAIIEINRVTAQFQSVRKKLKTNDIIYGDNNFNIFFKNIRETADYWTGCTYVGIRKNKSLQKAFQKFFQELSDFLLFCQQGDNSFLHPLRSLADEALYQGKVYRYIGHGNASGDCKSRIEPEYDGIYVSWSKKSNNHYVQSKLYGTMTFLTCDIDGTYYGIDLDAFGVVRGDEAEVVFPTIEERITEIQYIEEDTSNEEIVN